MPFAVGCLFDGREREGNGGPLITPAPRIFDPYFFDHAICVA